MKLPTLFSIFREFIAWRTKAVSAMQQMKTEYVLQLLYCRYGDGAGDTVEENSSIFSLI